MEFGSSHVIVPSVRELANDPNMVTVPPRYIRLDQHQDKTTILSPTLVHHGISNSLVEKIKEGVEELFKLPMEEKKKLWQNNPGDIEGFGDSFVFSEEQKLDWNDDLFLITLPLAFRKPHLFPNLPLLLRESLEIYSLELEKLAKDIISQMENVLGIKSKEISKLFEDGLQSMSINYYPPCPQPEQVIGVTPHSDAVGLTILLQINQVDGLQVKKDGILTNGIYPSIEHRAIVNSAQERLSLATFLNTNIDCTIGPVNSLITQENPGLYKTQGSKDYIKGIFSRELDGKSYVDVMKL
ncbi:hypothetical protein CsatA_022747 [Cannabis sativa]